MLYLAFFSKREGQIHSNFDRRSFILARIQHNKEIRGGEFYLEKRGSRKIFSGPPNLGSVYDKTRSLVFFMVCFYFFESRNFLTKESRVRISN